MGLTLAIHLPMVNWFAQAFVKGALLLWYLRLSFPGGSDHKESACNAGDPGLIPGSGRSPGEGNGTHFIILSWRIPWPEELGGQQSMGSHRVGHDWETYTFYVRLLLHAFWSIYKSKVLLNQLFSELLLPICNGHFLLPGKTISSCLRKYKIRSRSSLRSRRWSIWFILKTLTFLFIAFKTISNMFSINICMHLTYWEDRGMCLTITL